MPRRGQDGSNGRGCGGRHGQQGVRSSNVQRERERGVPNIVERALREDAAPLASFDAAERFVQEAENAGSRTELLWALVDTKKTGSARVQEVTRFAVSKSDQGVCKLVLPLLRALLGDGNEHSALCDMPLADLLQQVC